MAVNAVIHLADHKPNPRAAIIDLLETLLEEAKAGDVQGIALVYSTTSNEVATAFEYERWLDAVGASALLHRDVLKSGDE